jgi:hypothetical protein
MPEVLTKMLKNVFLLTIPAAGRVDTVVANLFHKYLGPHIAGRFEK